MHKLRLRTRSTAASKDKDKDNDDRTRSPEGSSSFSVFGRSSTSTTSISTSGRSSTPDIKGKAKEKAGTNGAGLKASIRSITGQDRKSTKTGTTTTSSNSNNERPPPTVSRPQLTLPTGNDFRASLILPELTRRFTLLRGKDGSLVPFNKMQAHLRVQRENGRLTENEEELVLRQYRLQSIYEAAQPHDVEPSGSSYSHTSPSSRGNLASLPEETGSLYSSRAPSRTHMYTPEPMTPSLSSPSLGATYSPYISSPYANGSSPNMLSSPQLVATSSSSASSPSSTPTPVSTVGFASSSAAEFYAARDAVMRGNGLFGGGGLEREIHVKMNSSPSLSNVTIDGNTTTTSSPGTPGKRYRSKRYTSTTTTTSPGRGLGDSESQHSMSNDGHSSTTQNERNNMFISAIPPVPKIIKPQEEEYDPFRPRDDDNQGYDQSYAYQDQNHTTTKTGKKDNDNKAIPPHLDVPMSKKQIHRISRALQDIEAELSRTYDFVGGQTDDNQPDEGMLNPESHQHSHDQDSFDYDYTPSDEEGGYNSSYDYSRNARNNFRHDDDLNDQQYDNVEGGGDYQERTFHSEISTGEEGSNSSEYNHQLSDRAPFIYDDTEEIDPALNRLPSQYEIDSRSNSALAGGNIDDGLERRGNQPKIEFNGDGDESVEGSLDERERHNSTLSNSTKQSDSTAIPDEGSRKSRSATTSTSTLDVIIDGSDEETYHHRDDQPQSSLYGQSLHPNNNGSNSRLSTSSNISKAPSSPGLPYLQPTPPIKSFEFPPTSTPPSSSPAPRHAGLGVTLPEEREASPADSSTSSGSINMKASTSNHTLSSVTTSHSAAMVSRPSGNSPSTSMTRLASNTSISSSINNPSNNSMKRLQGDFTPSHSRDGSTTSYNPPLSPPPQCGLPPVPSSSSSHSLASAGHASMHSNVPSIDSITLMSPSTSAQGLNMKQNQGKLQDGGKEEGKEEIEITEENVPFPEYIEENQQSESPNSGFETEQDSEQRYRGRYDSIQSSNEDVSSNYNPNRYSNTSTGSSWKGGPGGHTRNLSTSTVDFDLPFNSPNSKSVIGSPYSGIGGGGIVGGVGGHFNRPMTHIEEDIDEDDLLNSEKQSIERKKAIEYLNAPGLEMSDLRDIHERLVQSALQQRDLDQQAIDTAAELPSGKIEQGKKEEDDSRELDSGRRPSLEPQTLGDAKLGSPFMEQNGFADQSATTQDGSVLPTVSEEESVEAPQSSQMRNAASHPGFVVSQSVKASQSSQSLQKSASAGAGSGTVSPAQNGPHSTSPFGLQANDIQRSSPHPIVTSNNTPPSTLRSHQTRNSNATPSMLIRHVHQQASEATAALKNPFANPPDSPDEALWRVANMPARRTLSHRKSAKNLKIGSPQLVSSSANLQHMPMVDTMNRSAGLLINSHRAENSNDHKSPSTSPEVSRKASVAGLKSRMGFKNKTRDVNDDSYNSTSADQSATSAGTNSPLGASLNSRHMPQSSIDNSPSSGIRQLVAKLRRRKVSNEIPDKLIPDPLVLKSPHWSSPKELQGPLSPIEASLNNGQFTRRFGDGPPSISSHGTDTMADVSPLNVMDKSASSDKLSALATNTGDSNGSLLSAFGNLAVKSDEKGTDRTSATSLDSMRKLFEAATALGLDAERVNELVDAAGYRQSFQGKQPDNQVIRSTIILAPSDDSYFPPMPVTGMQSAPSTSGKDGASMSRSTSGNSLGRSRSARSIRHRNTSVSSISMSNGGSRSSRHGENTPNGSFTEGNGSSERRSVHDRAPTPPPDRRTQHRRQRSDAQAAETRLPMSPEVSVVPINSPLLHQPQPQYASLARQRNISNQSDDLPMPTAPFTRLGKDSRASYMSSKTSGSYDARSIYGLYGDDEEEIPPTPNVPDLNMILASGRIPGSSNASQRASLLLAPGVSAKRLSTASRNSRIELSEYANGDIAFNIVQSLRRPPGTGDGERGTYYPMDLHRRQNSDNSVEEELNALVASVNASPESDPLKLMIKRHMKEQNKSPTITPNAAMETIAHLQSLHPTTRQRSSSAATQTSSARSVFEIYEAQDEQQVAALIEELTRGLDEGQFNLSRNDSLTRAATNRSNKNKSTKVMESPSRQNKSLMDPASTPRAEGGVQRTPSKIKRQPPPTI